MRETTRTFLAIPVPDPIGQELLRLQAELSADVPGCRWTASSPFHITLAFLGDVPNRDLNELCVAVAAAVEPFAPLEVHLQGIGAFPSPKRPRVIWTGLSAAHVPPVHDLQNAVVQAATRAGSGPDDPKFHPHITLGRIKSDRGRGGDLTATLQRHQDWSGGSFPIVEVVTFASTLGPRGASYAPLGHAPLKGKKIEMVP